MSRFRVVCCSQLIVKEDGLAVMIGIISIALISKGKGGFSNIFSVRTVCKW